MIAPLLQKDDPPSMNRQPHSRANRPPIEDYVVHRPLQRHDTFDRKLRNRIILANALAWVLIIFTIAVVLI